VRAVYDTNVVLSGAGWRNESYQCLVAAARRQVFTFTTRALLDELSAQARRIEAAGEFVRDPWPLLNWWVSETERVDPLPLGKPRSRDPKDDEVLGCALAAKAQVIVTRDPDLLLLEKPFGISIVTPRELLHLLRRPYPSKRP
jgi:putative PIN family toxin of toxin-antitoxin system